MTDNIVFTADPATDLKAFLQQKAYSKVAVLVDEHTSAHCYPDIVRALPPHKTIQVPSGEEHKNITTCEAIWNDMTSENLDRHSVLIVLGGGVDFSPSTE